jgi:hypothetical protein
LATRGYQLILGIRIGICAVLLLWVFWDCYVTFDQFGHEDSTTFGPMSAVAAFPVYRCIMGLILLHWGWGCSLLAWTHARINYLYLMGLSPKTTRNYITVFTDATNMTIIFLFNLLLYYKTSVNECPSWIPPTFIPLLLFAWFNLKMVYQYHRQAMFLRVVLECCLSPFSPVTFYHSFVADYITSLVKVGIDYAWSWCYFATGEFLLDEPFPPASSCRDDWAFSHYVTPMICTLPLWFRLCQNARHYYDTGHPWPTNGNLFKYALMFVVQFFGLFHPVPNLSALLSGNGSTHGDELQILWLTLFTCSSLYAYTWYTARSALVLLRAVHQTSAFGAVCNKKQALHTENSLATAVRALHLAGELTGLACLRHAPGTSSWTGAWETCSSARPAASGGCTAWAPGGAARCPAWPAR